jgi:predicted phosphodiesterase
MPALIQGLKCVVVRGNHDEYASSAASLESFNPLAEAAIRWTRAQLTEEEKAWLRALPLVVQTSGLTVVHASLHEPDQWTYVLNQLEAAESFAHQETQVCFLGHTHSPRIYVRDASVVGEPFTAIQIHPARSYLINVGSVG